MSNCGLSGSLPPNLMEMRSLEKIDLSHNTLSGVIPIIWESSFLDGNHHLKQIDLSHNSLDGRNLEWTNAKMISEINLSYNSLSGPLPINMMGSHLSLQKLWINNNFFNGDFGPLRSMGRLEVLDVSSTEVYGAVPPKIMRSPGL